MSKVMIYSNEHKGWWKPYYFGYTQCSKEAGIFDLEDAIKKYPKLDYDTSNEDFLVDVSIEAIDNSNPSEALVWIDKHIDWNFKKIEELKNRDKGVADIYDNENKMLVTIKQALLKAQQPKHYIKWEDLEKFKDKDSVKVKMNDTELSLIIQIDCLNDIYVQLYKEEEDGNCVNLLSDFFRNKELFNNLRLELLE